MCLVVNDRRSPGCTELSNQSTIDGKFALLFTITIEHASIRMYVTWIPCYTNCMGYIYRPSIPYVSVHEHPHACQTLRCIPAWPPLPVLAVVNAMPYVWRRVVLI